jgi:hypothetical protein
MRPPIRRPPVLLAHSVGPCGASSCCTPGMGLRVKWYQKWVVEQFYDAGGGYDSVVSKTASLPRWLGPVSRLNLLFLRLGFRIGTQHALSVPGRKTGKIRSTPVSLVILDGQRYIVSGESLSWTKNATGCRLGRTLAERSPRARETHRTAGTRTRPDPAGVLAPGPWRASVHGGTVRASIGCERR